MRVMSFDPGGTTGWAFAHSQGGSLWWEHGQIPQPDHHEELAERIHRQIILAREAADELMVVSESFEYRNINRAGLVLDSVEYIGVIKLVCNSEGIPLFFQTASQGKVRDKPTAFVKPNNLKKLDLWTPGQGHAMDAIGHALYFMINTMPNEFRKELLERGWKS